MDSQPRCGGACSSGWPTLKMESARSFKMSVTVNIHGVIFQKPWAYVAEASLGRGVALAINTLQTEKKWNCNYKIWLSNKLSNNKHWNLVKYFITSRCLLLTLPACTLPIIFLLTFSASVAAFSSSTVRTLDRIFYCLCPLIRQCIRVHCFRLRDTVGLGRSVLVVVHCQHHTGRVNDRQGKTKQLEEEPLPMSFSPSAVHVCWPGTEPEHWRWKTASNRLSQVTAQ